MTTDPVQLLWWAVLAGARDAAEARVLFRARTPNTDFFAEHGCVGELVTHFLGPGESDRFRVGAGYDDAFVAAVARTGAGDVNRTVGRSRIVWARIEDKKALDRLRAFRSGPSLLLREGGSVRHVAVWVLDARITLEYVERANKRLAYHLGAKQKWSHPEAMWLPVPGSTLRDGRASRPLLVRCEVCAPERVYTAKLLVGALKDPPPPRDFREVAA